MNTSINLHKSEIVEVKRSEHSSSECNYKLIEITVTDKSGEKTVINIFSDEHIELDENNG